MSALMVCYRCKQRPAICQFLRFGFYLCAETSLLFVVSGSQAWLEKGNICDKFHIEPNELWHSRGPMTNFLHVLI